MKRQLNENAALERAAKVADTLELLYPTQYSATLHETATRDSYRETLAQYRTAVADSEAAQKHTSSPFVYKEQAAVSLLIPDKAPVRGGVEILVHGRGFASGLTCVFDEVATPAQYLSEDLLACVAPASSKSGPVPLTLKARDLAVAAAPFTYVDDVEITATAPKAGPLAGGTLIRVMGSGFENTTWLGCRFGGLLTAASYVNEEELRCATPPASRRSRVPVEITIDGAHFASAADARFDFVDAPSVDAFAPSLGPDRGRKRVKVVGRRFSRTTVCALDGVIVTTTVLSSTLSSWCAAPISSTVRRCGAASVPPWWRRRTSMGVP